MSSAFSRFSLEVVALAAVGVDLDHAVEMLELRMSSELGWRALAEEGEDQPEIFTHRPGAQRDLLAEGVFLCRLLDAVAVRRELPAVIEAAQRIAFDPAGREPRAAMRADGIDEMGGAALAAVEGELFAHDADRHRAAGRQVHRAIERRQNCLR